MKPRALGRVLGGLGGVLVLLCQCQGSDGGKGDAGGLSDIPSEAESFSVAPASIVFEDVAVGETDVQAVELTNHSIAALALADVSLVETDDTVRFANLFLEQVGRGYRWVDNDGDGHDFESRPEPIQVDPGAVLMIIVQYRPDGSVLECPDRPPAPCGFLLVSGLEETVSVPLVVPR